MVPETSFFIDDQCTETAFIRALDRQHGVVRFEYRPTLIEDRATIVERASKMQGAAIAERYIAEETAKRIVSWNLVSRGPDGQLTVAPISAENLLRIRVPSLFSRIVDIVIYGSDVGDIDQENQNAKKNVSGS